MFGRVRRPSISSLELLELQRPPQKIIKHDSFSIYETTLLKLKEGSHRCLSLPQEEVRTDDIRIIASHSPETSDLDCHDSCSPLNSNAIEDNHFSNESKRGNSSVRYLFSKYTSSRGVIATEDDEKAMDIEGNCEVLEPQKMRRQWI